MGLTTQSFCIGQNPTLSNIELVGQNIKWYDATGALLPMTTTLINGTTYYASQSINACESINRLAVTINVNNNTIAAKDFSEPAFCNDTTDNFKIINLKDYETKLISNTTGLKFSYYNLSGQLVPDFTKTKIELGYNIFNVKIENNFGCSQWFKLDFTLLEKPKITLAKTIETCKGLSTILDPGTCSSCTYLWSTGETTATIEVSKAGSYSVKVTNVSGCENSASTVISETQLAVITSIQINNQDVQIIMPSDGDYLYSLDQINWQNSNIFKDLKNGSYTVYVKTKAGCIVDHRDFTIFKIPNTFTPNHDGINDTWKIDGLENYPQSEVQIVDRFGKKVFEIKTQGPFEWDGKSSGYLLPTSTYWYQIKVTDGRIFTGYVLIKNRD
ncbi:T9SS type B sorting domain-containing protein [Chryseobacterium sp. T1]